MPRVDEFFLKGVRLTSPTDPDHGSGVGAKGDALLSIVSSNINKLLKTYRGNQENTSNP
jgi:hypothetical protein